MRKMMMTFVLCNHISNLCLICHNGRWEKNNKSEHKILHYHVKKYCTTEWPRKKRSLAVFTPLETPRWFLMMEISPKHCQTPSIGWTHYILYLLYTIWASLESLVVDEFPLKQPNNKEIHCTSQWYPIRLKHDIP